MAIRTISAAGGNWNATATWVGGVVPTSSDSVLGDATSGQLTINVGATCQFVDFTNYTQTLTLNGSNFTLGLAGGTSIFGSGMNFAIVGTPNIICNVNHSFTQNTTNRISRLSFGGGTKTLNTDLYVAGFLIGATTAVSNGFTIYINTLFDYNGSSTNRIGGTTELIIDGNVAWNVSTWQRTTLPNCPTKIDASGSTITCSQSLSPIGRFEILNGTVVGSSPSQFYISLSLLSVPIIKITNGQYFSFYCATSNNITFEGTSQIKDLFLANTSTPASSETTKIITDTNMTIRNIVAGDIGNYRTLRLPVAYTFNVAGFLLIAPYDFSNNNAAQDFTILIKSDTPGTKVNLNYTGSLCMNYYVNFTDINASGGNTIYTYNGTISNSDNIQSVLTYPPILGGGGGGSFTFVS